MNLVTEMSLPIQIVKFVLTDKTYFLLLHDFRNPRAVDSHLSKLLLGISMKKRVSPWRTSLIIGQPTFHILSKECIVPNLSNNMKA